MKRMLAAVAVAIAVLTYVIMAMRAAGSCIYPREYRDVYEQIQAERMITG